MVITRNIEILNSFESPEFLWIYNETRRHILSFRICNVSPTISTSTLRGNVKYALSPTTRQNMTRDSRVSNFNFNFNFNFISRKYPVYPHSVAAGHYTPGSIHVIESEFPLGRVGSHRVGRSRQASPICNCP